MKIVDLFGKQMIFVWTQFELSNTSAWKFRHIGGIVGMCRELIFRALRFDSSFGSFLVKESGSEIKVIS